MSQLLLFAMAILRNALLACPVPSPWSQGPKGARTIACSLIHHDRASKDIDNNALPGIPNTLVSGAAPPPPPPGPLHRRQHEQPPLHGRGRPAGGGRLRGHAARHGAGRQAPYLQ